MRSGRWELPGRPPPKPRGPEQLGVQAPPSACAHLSSTACAEGGCPVLGACLYCPIKGPTLSPPPPPHRALQTSSEALVPFLLAKALLGH